MVEQTLVTGEVRLCRVCEKPLPPDAHGNQIYCSNGCMRANKNRLLRLRRAEQRKQQRLRCIVCGKEFSACTPGAHFYCSKCKTKLYKEYQHKYYIAKLKRAGTWKEPRYCPNCGARVMRENEAYCSRCRRKYKILR